MAVITDPKEMDRLMLEYLSSLPKEAIEKFCKDFNVPIHSSSDFSNEKSELIDIDET